MKKLPFAFAAIILISNAQISTAQLLSNRVATLSTTTGSWAAVPMAQNGQPTSSTPYRLNFKVSASTAVDYFEISNTGNFTLQSLTISVSRSSTDEVFFNLCPGIGWNTGSCQVSPVAIGKASDGSIPLTNLNLAPSAKLSIQATTSSSAQNKVNADISVLVPRSSIRSGQITNS